MSERFPVVHHFIYFGYRRALGARRCQICGKAARQRVNRPEEALQRAVVELLDAALMPPALFTCFPAGGGGRLRGAVFAVFSRAAFRDIASCHEIRRHSSIPPPDEAPAAPPAARKRAAP